MMPPCDHGLLPCLCCSCHQEVECIFPSLWSVLALWVSFPNTMQGVMFWDLLRPEFKRLFPSAFTQKNCSHHVRSPGYPAVERSQVGREVLGDKKSSGGRGPVKESQSSKLMRKPSQHQGKEQFSRPSQPQLFWANITLVPDMWVKSSWVL